MAQSQLNAAAVRNISKPGRYADGGTLYLLVADSGAKSWVQRITVDGRRRDIGLGSFPTISLAKARERAMANRLAVANGRDPLADRRRAKTPTFREAAQATFEANRPRWRDTKTARNWMQGMQKRAFPVIGKMPVDRIRREDILRILKPVWSAHPDVARKLRQRIRATLRWCQAHGYVEQNVAGEAIDGALPPMPTVRTHHRALPYAEVRACLDTVRASRASPSARLCLEFLVLTATRSGEARGARWDEIDHETQEWHIGADRMKTGTAHAVPLSDPAMRVLEQARSLRGDPLVFPSPVKRKQPLSDMTLMKVLHMVGLGRRATVHGFRSSFRTWAGECTETAHAVMELCLAHTVGNAVERAYARSDLLEKRRALMAQWGALCATSSTDAPPSGRHHVCPGLDGPNTTSAVRNPAHAPPASPDHPAPTPHPPPTDLDPAAAVSAGKLTTDAAFAISKPGRYSDGNTLYLKVAETGSKSWIQRIVVGGRRRDIGLGAFPVVSLAKARSRARANRVALSEGRDPLAETRRRRARAPARSSRAPSSLTRSRAIPATGPVDTNTARASEMPDINDCVNDTCPWSGESVQPDALTRYCGHVVGFCNPICRDKFDAAIRHFEQSAAPAALA